MNTNTFLETNQGPALNVLARLLALNRKRNGNGNTNTNTNTNRKRNTNRYINTNTFFGDEPGTGFRRPCKAAAGCSTTSPQAPDW